MPILHADIENIKNHNKRFYKLHDQGIFDNDPLFGQLIEALNQNPKIKKLDLSNNNLTEKAVEQLTTLKYVTTLVVNRNNINSAGAVRLTKESILEELQLEINPVDPEDLKTIAEQLEQNKKSNLRNILPKSPIHQSKNTLTLCSSLPTQDSPDAFNGAPRSPTSIFIKG